MNKRTPGKRLSATTVVKTLILAGAAVFLGVNLLFTVPSPRPSIFKGYYTVYYRGERPLRGVVDFIRKQADVEAVVSRETAEILYTNFFELEHVPFSEVANRFDELDPRLDDYMKKLGRYFSVEEAGATWDVFFVATRRNPLYLSLLLKQVSPDAERDWYICELDKNEVTILLAIVGFLFFLCLMLLSRRTAYHLLVTAGILPWLYALARGGISDFLLFFFIAYYWALFVQRYLEYSENQILSGFTDADRRPLWLHAGIYGGVVLFTFFFTSLYKTDLIEITLALLGQGLLLGVHWGVLAGLAFLKTRKKWRLVRGFRPLVILRSLTPGKRPPFLKNIASHGLFALLAFLPFVLLFKPAARSFSLPLPEPRAQELGISLEAIRRLDQSRNPDALPDLADFVRHAAFQERLTYAPEASYSLPEQGERIVLSGFTLNGPEPMVEKKPKVLLAFNDVWLSRLATIAGQCSIERMLFNQGQCLTVSFRKAAEGDFFIQYNWTIILVWAIALCPLVLLQYTSVTRLLYGRRGPLFRQAAAARARKVPPVKKIKKKKR